MLFETIGPSQFTMRHYQDKAIDAAIDWLYEKEMPSGILQMATGTGKTPMAGELIRRCFQQNKVNRVLVLAHRHELITQACNCFDNSGLSTGREQGKWRADALYPAQVVVATVQTMASRIKNWKKDEFDLIIVDECHHASATTYVTVFEHFEKAKRLGITATIDRSDKKSLKQFTEVIYSYNLWDAIHDQEGPFLTPLKFIRINVGADLRDCRTIGKKGDYNLGDLGKAIQPFIETFSNAIVKEIGNAQTMVFMPCVASSMAMSSALNQLGLRSKWVSGDCKDRSDIIRGYQVREFQVIVNCNLLGEGFDDKATECVVVRPTKSRIVYAQQVGRATRLFAGKKFARIIDFNHTTDMDLIGPSSLAELPFDVKKIVDKISKEEKEVNLWDAIERAEDEVKKQREVLSVPVAKLDMNYRRVEVNPFQAAENLGVLSVGQSLSAHATLPQINLLKKFGFADSQQLSKIQASRIIKTMFERKESGLCSIRQLNLLVSLGVTAYTARHMSFEKASTEIGKRLGNSR